MAVHSGRSPGAIVWAACTPQVKVGSSSMKARKLIALGPTIRVSPARVVLTPNRSRAGRGTLCACSRALAACVANSPWILVSGPSPSAISVSQSLQDGRQLLDGRRELRLVDEPVGVRVLT